MRITRKSYEKAVAVVAAARDQLKLVKTWEDAVRQLGNLGNQQLVALTVNKDGTIKTECELVSAPSVIVAIEEKPELPR